MVKTTPNQSETVQSKALDIIGKTAEIGATLLGLREIAEIDRTVAIVAAGVMGGNMLGQLFTTGVITTGAQVIKVASDKDVTIKSGADNSLEIYTGKEQIR